MFFQQAAWGRQLLFLPVLLSNHTLRRPLSVYKVMFYREIAIRLPVTNDW